MGDGPGLAAVSGKRVGAGPLHSSGAPQRSHQIAIPRLPWRHEGHRTVVPMGFVFEPSLSMSVKLFYQVT